VFLDEIGEMVPGLQAKMLRFLEEKSFKRVGGAVDIRVDVRVVAATNRTLANEVKEGRFREDFVLPPQRAADRAAVDCAPGLATSRSSSTTTSMPTTGSSESA
jgi:sigma54-dependent transcription regulator